MNRTFILREIEKIRTETNNFEGDKFKELFHAIIYNNASEIDFNALDDHELSFLYKRLIDRWNPTFSESGVCKCVCGGNAEVNSSYTDTLCYCGYAYVKCNNCGLEISQKSTNLGYDGVTLDTLKASVLESWNMVIDCKC